MEYLALYRKYRPKNFNEVVGQEEIKKILTTSVKNNMISHAYLFSGPRGTGKTTTAKIFAKMVNCENNIDGNACGNCNSCKNILSSGDVIEIDAASNNGVDEIRDLREKANLVPSSCRYKVYIIDEVHMLTTQAFNALLKILEEPPKHIIFILATTEFYKIPLTIASRCQKFQFNKICDLDIVVKLREICLNENINISDDALFEIARLSDGGMRDSINFLDQLRSFGDDKINVEDVYRVCGSISFDEIVQLFINMRNNNASYVVNFLDNINVLGKSYDKFLENFELFLRDIVLYKQNVSDNYIKCKIDDVSKVSSMYSIDEVFYIINQINELMIKLKNISRQSVVIVTNFLLIVDYLNNENIDNVIMNNNAIVKEKDASNYELAFNFTSNDSDRVNNLQLFNSENEKLNTFVDKNKEIIINNAFALANKKMKDTLQEKLSNLNSYFTDSKFSSVAGILYDTSLEVVGDNYIIFSGNYDAVVNKVYDNFHLCSELINLIFSGEYYFAVVSKVEWQSLRDEYIKKIRSGKKYKVMDIVPDFDVNIKNNVNNSTVVDRLFDLVGEDVVEFR